MKNNSTTATHLLNHARCTRLPVNRPTAGEPSSSWSLELPRRILIFCHICSSTCWILMLWPDLLWRIPCWLRLCCVLFELSQKGQKVGRPIFHTLPCLVHGASVHHIQSSLESWPPPRTQQRMQLLPHTSIEELNLQSGVCIQEIADLFEHLVLCLGSPATKQHFSRG